MNSEQFTASVRQVISDAQKVALRRHHQKMTDLHLLSPCWMMNSRWQVNYWPGQGPTCRA